MKNLILISAFTLLIASCASPSEETKIETTDSTHVAQSADTTVAKVDTMKKVDTISVKK